jgi:hypothetical protein
MSKRMTKLLGIFQSKDDFLIRLRFNCRDLENIRVFSSVIQIKSLNQLKVKR